LRGLLAPQARAVARPRQQKLPARTRPRCPSNNPPPPTPTTSPFPCQQVNRLSHPKEAVRKKAVMALHHFIRLDPHRTGALAGAPGARFWGRGAAQQ
jgi:hypothetical protein